MLALLLALIHLSTALQTHAYPETQTQQRALHYNYKHPAVIPALLILSCLVGCLERKHQNHLTLTY